MTPSQRQLAIVTGASSGIGKELALHCAKQGFDLVIAADRGPLNAVAEELRAFGSTVSSLQVDIATRQGVDELLELVGTQPVDALFANAGHGLGKGFLEQDFDEVEHVINTNITGTIYLIQQVVRRMRRRGSGRVLITGSIAGFIPGTYQAVYIGTKAFIDSFSFALRAELKDTGVTVTCLMPGATETEFFERADLMDTQVGQSEKDDPADVAKLGYEAMMRGDGDVVSGWRNKIQVAMSGITPMGVLAEMHRRMTEPGSGKDNETKDVSR